MMKKKDLVVLYKSLHKLSNLTGVKFSYCVSKNIAMITPEIKLLDECIEPSEDFIKFDNERAELAKTLSKKDEKGSPVIEIKDGISQYVLENTDEFQKGVNAIKEKYKEAVAEREIQLKEYNDLLEEEIVLMFHKIKLEYIPENISPEQMNSIFEIIAE